MVTARLSSLRPWFIMTLWGGTILVLPPWFAPRRQFILWEEKSGNVENGGNVWLVKGWLYPCAFPANEHTDPTGQGSRYSAAWEWVGKHPYLSTPNFSQKAPPVFGIRHLCYVLYYSLAASNVCPPSIPQKVISLFCRLLWLWSSM